MRSRLLEKGLTALVAMLLAACGGSETATPPVAAQAAPPALAALSVAASAEAASPQEAALQLLAFAESSYPAWFPAGVATQTAAPFVYRHYAATGALLGVVTDAGSPYPLGGVYVMGASFGAEPVHVGQVTDFITPQAPLVQTVLASRRVLVTQGSSTRLRVDLTRLRGFSGPVQLTLGGLPAGVSAPTVTLAAGETAVELELSAMIDAPHSLPTTVTLQASAGALQLTDTLSVTVRGRPGTLDTTFSGGSVSTAVNQSEDYLHAAAVQADGRIVAVGTTAISSGTAVAVVRYQRHGALDTGFGQGGKVVVQVGARGDSARAVALQPDGRIVVAGWSDASGTNADFLVLRFLPDGQPDIGFGDRGRLVLPIGQGTDRAHAVAVQADGRIVVAGETQSGANGRDFALVRLHADGRLDTGFGSSGTVVTPMSAQGGSDTVYALALPVIGGEQRILAVGGEGDFMAARYSAGGELDGGFGSGGKVVGLFGRNIGQARAVALLPDGRMLLAGGIYNDFAAAMLSPAGQLDGRFGVQGLVTLPVSASNWDNATAVVRQADGKFVLGGWSYAGAGTAGDFVALRLLPDGQLDTGFGAAGIATHALAAGTRSDNGRALVLQADDEVPAVRAIQAGEVSRGNYDFGLLRLWL